MLPDAPGGCEVLWDDLGCFKVPPIGSCYPFQVPGLGSWVLPDASGCPGYCEVLPDAPEFHQLVPVTHLRSYHWDIGCFRMLPDAPGCCEVLPDALGYFKVPSMGSCCPFEVP